ncbi:hypothetical protein TWF718_003608 [Orbilia javanica]|uniref:Uncharacterized protein n=1 Tax=Orbilia javanica TaxID=47235 RepID=A0AAN8N3X0_9PEZI
MPVPKRRHQREPPSGELIPPEESPEPKRHQRETARSGSPVTQDQPTSGTTRLSAAITSNPSSISPPPPRAVRPNPFRRIYEEMSSRIGSTHELPDSDEESSPTAQGGHAPSGSNLQPRGGAATGTPHRATGVGATSSAPIANAIGYPPPPDRPPPLPPSGERSDVGGPTHLQQAPPYQSLFPVSSVRPSSVEGFSLWGGLSEAEIRRQVSLLEALERRRHRSLSPSPGPLSPSIISPLTSPPLSPRPLAPGSNRLGPPPLPPSSNSVNQSQSSLRLGSPPLPPAHQAREVGPQRSQLTGPGLPGYTIRPEILSASSFTRHSDRASSSEGLRPRRGAMSIHFDDSVTRDSEAQMLYATMRGSTSQASMDLIQDFRAPGATGTPFFQTGIGPIPPTSTSASVDPPRPISQSKRAHSEPKKRSITSNKGKQRQDNSTEARPRTRYLGNPRDVRSSHSAAAPSQQRSSAHDPTFRFSASRGYYEAIVPIAYVMNNPNTRPLSTTDPFFRCFPSDPDEVPFLRGTRLAAKPPTPEIHLDETVEQKEDHLNQVELIRRKQDWISRRDVSLPRSWYLQYSSRPRSIVPVEQILSGLSSGSGIPFDDFAEAEFQRHLAKMKQAYRKERRGLEIEREADSRIPGYIQIDGPAKNPLVSSRSRRTAQPEEAQPLEVGRESERVQGQSPGAGTSSARNVPEQTDEPSQGKKKESRRHK